jgi:hypothetical protein
MYRRPVFYRYMHIIIIIIIIIIIGWNENYQCDPSESINESLSWAAQ